MPTALLIISFLPMWSGAYWPSERGNPGKTGHRGTSLLTPPAGVMGEYRVPRVAQTSSELLLDQHRVYTHSGFGVTAVRREEAQDGVPFFIGEEIVWSYMLDPVDEDGQVLQSVNSTIVLVDGTIVFAKRRQFVETNQMFSEILGLDAGTGEEVWRYDLGLSAPARPVELLALGNSVIVRYVATDEDHNDTRVLLRLQPGQADPLAVGVQAEGTAGGFQGMAAVGQTLYMAEFRRIEAYNAATLDHLWTHAINQEQHGDAWNGSVRDIIGVGNAAYVSLTTHHMFSLSNAGALRWTRDLEGEEDCGTHLVLSSNREILIASAFCGMYLLGIDLDSGQVLWQSETEGHQYPFPPVISGSSIFLPAMVVPEIFPVPAVLIHDIETGEELQVLETGSWPIINRFAAADGLVFAFATGLFGSNDTRIVVLEEEPAELEVGLTASESISSCGAFVGTPVAVTLEYSNLGPGTARNASIRLRNHGGRFEIIPPGDVEWREDFNGIEIDLGDVEPSGPHSIELTVIPEEPWETRLNARIASDVRNTSEHGEDTLRFPVNAALPDDLHIAITSVEVTQGIQDLENSVDLVARKPTLVRVHTESSGRVEAVSARLYVTGGEVQGSVSPRYQDELILPLQDCVLLPEGASNRGSTEQSFDFVLPSLMLLLVGDDSLELRVELDPDGNLPMADRSGLVHTETIQFTSYPAVCLVTHSVRTLDDNGDDLIPDSRIPDTIMARAEALVPTHEIKQFSARNVLEKATITGWAPYELDPGGSQNTGRILLTLWYHDKTSSRPVGCPFTSMVHQAGVVGENVQTTDPDGARWSGVGYRPGWSLAFRINNVNSTGINQPHSGRTLAHELGHNYGRRHVDCPSPSGQDPDGVDPHYPYDPCLFTPLSNGVYFGTDLIDPVSPVIIDPNVTSAGDLLSYAGTRWVSDYSWRAMQDYMLSKAKALELRKAEPRLVADLEREITAWLDTNRKDNGKEILFAAIVNDDGTGEIGRVLPVSPGVVLDEKRVELAAAKTRALQNGSPFTIELLDASDDVLMEIPAEYERAEDAEPGFVMVGALVPEVDGLATIRLVRDGTETIDEITRSANPPDVTLLHPEAGDIVDDLLIVEWDASDPDGNPLSTMVQYSHDDGETWWTLVTDAPVSPEAFDITHLPGAINSARVRLIVSDGFNTTEVISDAFSVEPRDPFAAITRPAHGAVYTVGDPVFVRGDAHDPDDGVLAEEALLWEIDGIGEVGYGRSILLTDLPIGVHELTLSVEDSLGNTASDSIQFVVVPRTAGRLDVLEHLLELVPVGPEVFLDRNLDGVIDSGDVVEP